LTEIIGELASEEAEDANQVGAKELGKYAGEITATIRERCS
jgi:hypothetical protein